jgi:hypothetical protein
VVIAAADEAGGQGFVTEQSTDASDFEGVLLPEFKESRFTNLRTETYDSKQAFLREVIDFGLTFNPTTLEDEFYDGFEDVMSDPAVLPLREGATAEQFLACVDCYFATDFAVANDYYPTTPYDAETDPIEQLDAPMLLSRLELDVLEPLRDTQALFDTHTTVTRFYTTLSPDEMNTDPVFDFNADLDPVSNVHTAQGVVNCKGDVQVTLNSGLVVNTDGSQWPVDVDDTMPTNMRILQLSTSGLWAWKSGP